MRRYDFYADMYAAHSEIGYLLWLLLLLLLCDGALALALALWPRSDVYLVPGISGYAQVPVIWGSRMPQVVQAPQASTSLLQVDLERLQRSSPSAHEAGSSAAEAPEAGTPPTTAASGWAPAGASGSSPSRVPSPAPGSASDPGETGPAGGR